MIGRFEKYGIRVWKTFSQTRIFQKNLKVIKFFWKIIPMKNLVFLLLLSICAFADEPTQGIVRPPNQEITAKAQPFVNNGVVEPYITADFIYWKAREDGLQYIITGRSNQLRPNLVEGKIYEPDFDGHIGFKVGLGLNIDHDGWDVYLQYTWIYSDEIDSFNGELPKNAQAVTGNEFLIGGITRSHVDWDFHMNVLDLEWGRHYYIGRFLRFRPFFGLKGFWSDQDYRIRSSGFQDFDRTILADTDNHFDDDSWGIGIRGGLQTSWLFTRNFSVFGNLALAAEWSRFYIKLKENGFFPATNTTHSLTNINNHHYVMIPILELALGLRWEIWFHQDSYHLAIQWGWEEQMWWNYARSFATFNSVSAGEDLNFQGLTVRIRFDF